MDSVLQQARERFPHYWQLMRFDRPIGTLLLLWPTLWGLWWAAEGVPRADLLIIFTLGVVLMRAAGCVINDFADRKVDGHVQRTKGRPIATGRVQPREALFLFAALILLSFVLVLFTNTLTIILSFGAVALAACYPFMKRYTHLPQVVLGAAFSWSIPMAFAAQTGEINPHSWLIYTAVVVWTVVYDTFYAMVDREDDLKIGVKSTAILFAEQDRVITASLQVIVLITLLMVGQRFEMGGIYSLSLVAVAGLFIYQQYLIRQRVKAACFQAFLNNNWVGCAVFVGIAGDYFFR
jgi:4-hydroxybenzoate polyprenyltransferase